MSQRLTSLVVGIVVKLIDHEFVLLSLLGSRSDAIKSDEMTMKGDDSGCNPCIWNRGTYKRFFDAQLPEIRPPWLRVKQLDVG